MWERIIPPDEHSIEHGAKYVCVIDRDGRSRGGKIYDENGDVRWQYDWRRNPEGLSWRNPLNKPGFVVTNPDGQVEIVIRRASFFPSTFRILEGNNSIGRITLPNVLGIKYRILLDGFPGATFRVPLFTRQFWGDTEGDASIWVVVGPSTMEWNVLLKPGTNDLGIVATIAFIHTQWCRFG